MAVEATNQPKLRWGELEDDAEDLDFLLPPKQIFGPDENGVKKVVEYKFNTEGNKVKITTTTRIRKLANARLSKRAVERRSWPKFGDAVHEDVGARLTMVSTEEIILERPRAPGIDLIFSYLVNLNWVFLSVVICDSAFIVNWAVAILFFWGYAVFVLLSGAYGCRS